MNDDLKFLKSDVLDCF